MGEHEIEVKSKVYDTCLCKEGSNLNDYFKECDKCGASGKLIINQRELVCNKCKGEKYVRIRECYLCHNHSKILMDSYIKLRLKKEAM